MRSFVPENYKTRMQKTFSMVYILSKSTNRHTFIPFEAPFKALAYITKRLNYGITVL